MTDDAISSLSVRLGGGVSVGTRWKRPLFHLAAWLARTIRAVVSRTGARPSAVTAMPWWVDHYVSMVDVVSRAGRERWSPADFDKPKRRL